MPEIRERTVKRHRAERADLFLENRLRRISRRTVSKLGVYCSGCRCDVLPLDDGTCPWCESQMGETDG